jgi:release factor glutamine methyltransferase
VLGRLDFAGITVEVDPGVFIPRPQTEGLATTAAALRPALALDLFAGCAAIACVVKTRNPQARVVAAELDPAALVCARRNGERYGVEVVAADVDAGLPPELEGRADVLTANVPYGPTSELGFVPHSGEPDAALDGGRDGLDWVRRVAVVAPRWLRPGGSLLVEVAEDAGAREAVEALMAAAGLTVAEIADRVVRAELGSHHATRAHRARRRRA